MKNGRATLQTSPALAQGQRRPSHMSNTSTTVTDLCADPLCMGEATHDMISRVPGFRTKMCDDHRKRVLAAAEKAGFSAEKIASLDIKPLRGT
jgi:hypothetical protein